MQDRQNGSSGLPEKPGWLRACVMMAFCHVNLMLFHLGLGVGGGGGVGGLLMPAPTLNSSQFQKI